MTAEKSAEVRKYGLFAIETKNYRGEIYGDDDRQEWTQIILRKVTYANKSDKTYTYVTKNYLYNPVKQSMGHVRRIKQHLTNWPYLKIIPIVVFTKNASLKSVRTRYHVINDRDLLDTILMYKTACLSEEDVKCVADYIASKDVSQLVDAKTHVRNVKSAQRAEKKRIKNGICPKCGGTLVKRRGEYGRSIGCSNYPYCRFTTHT